MVEISEFKDFQGVYQVMESGQRSLATVNLAPGKKVYDELLIKFKDEELRTWNPFRSKLAAALLNGLEELPIKEGDQILYLGAASGTTSSHISDIVGRKGRVYCVEFSPRAIRDLLTVCEYRKNMLPILADARFPDRYSPLCGLVDLIYCDIAQPDQSKILLDNAFTYLKPKGKIMMAIKARSIDVTKPPAEIFKNEIEFLEENGFIITQKIRLEPYTADHIFILGSLK
ncbi:MAG: fibrillarin-like rRNA/tRNA 2'-O-methyltransferase [Candidatus Odinarchaeum yellowstonii]|uniref:Fibrillarin-like rRNA/tRNA 2'-O-methyltransferase n=1 Tax=Odinarchaeota yellowstonii (strain LCB_4) TaxID=1841599 RepID=A0AAF0I9K1_ODILC|nr:MAG: fibrillarin-like rRNA/tRNA 2'-O-methyltransferase [Candidatus Odinarchaeum yellowstonii]